MYYGELSERKTLKRKVRTIFQPYNKRGKLFPMRFFQVEKYRI